MRGKKGLEYFESLHKQEGRKFAPLETSRILLEHLGNPQDKIKAIHVAGTNGKGTVCSLLSSMLISSRYKVGQSSSPHLTHVTERCLINGKPHNIEDFGEALENIVDICHRENLLPSYFVLGVVACFYEFQRLGLDWMVIEVGLGGEFDATNLMKQPKATVITNISLDHTEILGSSPVAIATTKAGIAKPLVPMFVGRVEVDVSERIREVCLKNNAPCHVWGEEFFWDEKQQKLQTNWGDFTLDLKKLKLAGKHQLDNAVLAAAVGSFLQIKNNVIENGLAATRWPGRLEYFSKDQADILLDVAHNPGGIDVLKEYILENVPKHYQSLTILLSILKRKDWQTMLVSLLDLGDKLRADGVEVNWIFTNSSHVDALAPEQMKNFISHGETIADPKIALEFALKAKDKKRLILVTGSLFLVGKIREDLCAEFESYADKSLLPS